MKEIIVIGGGLAGCEAAYQIAKREVPVRLYERKPQSYSPAHSNPDLAEIVCSNSLKSNLITNACGLLKEELRKLDSLLICCADETAVPAGQALAMDREKFAALVTQKIEENPLITVVKEEVTEIPMDEIVIVATGPLTSEKLTANIQEITGKEQLFFYDAAAPIVTKESIDMTKAFTADRYGKGESDYINCPMNQEEYEAFYQALIQAERVELREFEKGNLFEGCMPIEEMARRGSQTLTYGPLKPVGFGHAYYAVVQLRQDNAEGTLYNLVGFQTNLKFGEQKRVFQMIPALREAEFVRYGVMHRNTFLHSPELLDATYRMKETNLFFAGQITGVEGYVESISSGLVAGINAVQRYYEKPPVIFPTTTVIGSLANYVATPNEDFQPMNANFGLFACTERFKSKLEKYEFLAKKSLQSIEEMIQ